MNDRIREIAERQPRAYGALLLSIGGGALLLQRTLAEHFGRVSLVLVLLVPFLIVFGTQALVLGTTPSSLRGDRVTATVMFVMSAIGSVALWRWLGA